MGTAQRLAALGWVLATLALALLPWVFGKYAIDLAARTMVMAVFAMSLQLLVGQVGLVSFGQAAFFGIGAYAAVLLSPAEAPAQLLLVTPAALAASIGYALVTGTLSLRTRGVYFIMVTLAFAQLAYTLAHDTALVGGSDGIYLNARPIVRLGGSTVLDLGHPLSLYYLIFACLLLVYLGLSRLAASRFGRALIGIQHNEARMRAAGYETVRFKLAAFVVAAAVAGLAGVLWALKDGYVNPEILSWHQSGRVLLMVILGGAGSLRGALAGAAGLTLLEELFQSESLFGPAARHWQLPLGLAIIALVASLPRGLAGWTRRRLATPAAAAPSQGA
jgi:branched-chain amino acid transport system permease protein